MTDWTNEQLCQRHGELASRSLTEDLQADEETELQAVRAELDRRDPTDLSAFEEHVRRVEQLADHVDEVRDTFLEELLAWTPSAETLAMAERLLEVPMSEPARYALVSDNDGHQYACPVELVDDFHAAVEACDAYWGPNADYASKAPDDPGDLDGVVRIDGTFTFTDPRS